MFGQLWPIPSDFNKRTAVKTKITTTEELHNLNANNEEIEIVKDVVHFGINPNGDCSQEIRGVLRPGRN